MASDDRLIATGGHRLHHAPSLDGFRGLGVMIVVFFHAEVLAWMSGAMILIDWFFVCSGFLITMIILDERGATGTNSLRRFYQRRLLRLFPAMYAMLATFTVFALLATTVNSEARTEISNWWIDALAAATYCYYIIAAVIPNQVTGAIGHTWSLSLEEQFYFLWPLLIVFVLNKARRQTDRGLLVAMAIFMATVMALRIGLHSSVTIIGQPGQTTAGVKYVDIDEPTLAGIVYRLTAVRPDMIAYGCLLAIIHKRLPDPLPAKGRQILAILGTIGWIAMSVFIFMGNRARTIQILGQPIFDMGGGTFYNVALLLLGPFILDLYRRPDSLVSRILSWQPLRYLGVRTYGIYLWHVLPILVFLPAIMDSWGIKRLALGLIAGSLGVIPGILSFRYIEKRFLHLKDTKYRRPQDELPEDCGEGPKTT